MEDPFTGKALLYNSRALARVYITIVHSQDLSSLPHPRLPHVHYTSELLVSIMSPWNEVPELR
jgi:hypothetical protein